MSGGERQRLVIARALLRPSRVVLLDEAFSALDPKTRQNVEVCICRIVGLSWFPLDLVLALELEMHRTHCVGGVGSVLAGRPK